MDDVIAQLLPEVITAALIVFGAIGTYSMKKFKEFVDANVRDQHLRHAISVTQEIVNSTVKSISQTTARELKEASADGKITAEEAKKLKKQAIDRIKKKMGREALDRLELVTDDVEAFLEDKIEEVLHDAEK